ncbi:hypothetical protein [Oryza sativa Japonica Group]|uniref:Uncharacterized protein n=1 Tax=Oryza sativa subsp. japonica TaxID=39947 RepID=Q5N8I3_ORYSJ|nr:hypothetical protein [Oryza sativa Japonica Group]BAD82215.1 hypothetical protein [Oryza sativa Japonica Group]
MAFRCRERWWRRRPAHRGRGRGGRRRNSGGNATVAGGDALPEVFAGNRGQAGVEGDAVTSREDGDDDGCRTDEGRGTVAGWREYSGTNATGCRRGHRSGEFPARRR